MRSFFCHHFRILIHNFLQFCGRNDCSGWEIAFFVSGGNVWRIISEIHEVFHIFGLQAESFQTFGMKTFGRVVDTETKNTSLNNFSFCYRFGTSGGKICKNLKKIGRVIDTAFDVSRETFFGKMFLRRFSLIFSLVWDSAKKFSNTCA